MLRGIDVSSHDGWSNGRFGRSNTETAYGESDFVIAKATQGTGYVNPYCDPAIQRARRDGKLWGFYHYAGGGDPVAEANYFYNNCKGYFGEGIPCLDWESMQNASWGSTTWCRRFVDRIHELTGVWCMVYVQASAVGQAASCASDCALWIAGYPDNRNYWDMPTFRYSTGAWPTWTLWQYTSSGGLTDRNYAQLSREGWLAIAGATSGPQDAYASIQLYDVNGTDAQRWRVSWDDEGYVTLTSVSCGLALDVAGAGIESGTPVRVYTPNGTDAQKWKTVQDDGNYSPDYSAPVEFVPKVNEELRLDIVGNEKGSGTGVQVYERNDTDAQKWSISDHGDGTWSIIAVSAQKALDVVGGGK
jgi:hypothetical protein